MYGSIELDGSYKRNTLACRKVLGDGVDEVLRVDTDGDKDVPWLEEEGVQKKEGDKERRNLYPMDFYAKEGLGRTTVERVQAAEVGVRG